MRSPAALAALLACLLAGALVTGAALPAAAQLLNAPLEGDPDAKMLLESDELLYNVETGRVTAVGNVYIEYRGYQVFARQVSYDEASNRLTASGGVRLEDPEGNTVIAEDLDLADDLATGFLTGLRADTIYRTRLAANRAERIGGNVTVFEDAGYTACWSCRRRPDRPPTWAIKARRVIYNEDADTLRFEEPRFDIFGTTVGPFPSFTIPDPTVRRKSGLLIPTGIYSNLLGFGVRVPYFQTIGPYRDVTVAVTPLTRQGVFGDIEYRERTPTGDWMLRGAGIWQLDPGAFESTSADRRFRGALTTRGSFLINPEWTWGWEGILTTDRRFLDDYKQRGGDGLTAPSTLFLTGLGERTSFDARLWAFRILQDDYDSNEVLDPPPPFSDVGSQLQGKQAFVHPVIDYDGVVGRSVLGGELSWSANLTSLSRQETDAFGAVVDGTTIARFRGVEGTFTRGSAEIGWRRRLYAPLGQVITPFTGARADVFAIENRDPNVDLDDGLRARLMPYAGINYRWPWLITADWGTQVVEPIAEIIARPNEGLIGDVFNEDAQSVVFDDTNLFGTTKFSGYDRVEGGVRANIGIRYTLQTYAGGALSIVAGQSYQIAGRSSYEDPDILDSSGNSGLTTSSSDYVAGLSLDTNRGLTVTAKGRFNENTFDVERAELAAAALAGPLATRVVYAYLAEQPDIGIIDDREEVQGSASLRVTDRVRVFGLMRYDIVDEEIIREGVGIAYDDDALSASIAYSHERADEVDDPDDQTVFFRIGLRTIGDVDASAGLDN
jgi:LPS-assembly protein